MAEHRELNPAERVEMLNKSVKKDWKAKAVKHAGRFVIVRNKRIQADGAVSNVKVLLDEAEDVRYTITITGTVNDNTDPEKGGGDRDMDEYDLTSLQNAFTEFLKTIHEAI